MRNSSQQLVSVLMSAYNHAPYVGDAIESVLSQSHKNIEFLITDDGSSDETVEEIKRFRDKRITFVPYSFNRGACAATNELIQKARGKYVCIINSDDIWSTKDKVRNQVHIMESNSEFGAIFGRAQYIDCNGNSLDKNTLPGGTIFDQENRPRYEWLSHFFMQGNCLCHPTVMIRKECYDRLGGYRNSFRQLPDLEMWIRLAKKYEINVSDEELVSFRILPGLNASSPTRANKIRHSNELHIIKKEFFNGLSDIDFKAGFHRYFVNKDASDPVSLSIEKALLYFHGSSMHSDADKIIGLERIIYLQENSEARIILDTKYGIDHRWIHKKMGQVTTLVGLEKVTSKDNSREIKALKSSLSWKITYPLRFLNDTARKIIAKTNKKIGFKKKTRNDYQEWIHKYDTLDFKKRSEIRYKVEHLSCKPVISVIMPCYNSNLKFLKKAIESVINQLYPNWELCIADDASTDPRIRRLLENYTSKDSRIKVAFRDKNGHISEASNTALSMANGEWIAFMDHDDLLAENALSEVACAINENPQVLLIYSDEDKIGERGDRFEPHFKSDWNPDLLLSQNYISHLTAIKSELVKKVKGFRKGFEGSQDYDLILRSIIKIDGAKIHHIAKILYHWRAIPGSVALEANQKDYTTHAGIKAIKDYFIEKDVNAEVSMGHYPNTYNVTYRIPKPEPLVSIIIPTRDQLELTQKCLSSIFSKTNYKNFEIIIIDNESEDIKTLEYFARIKREKANVKIIKHIGQFNYSAINNYAVNFSSGKIIGLLNNDIEVISPNWLSVMVSHAIRPEIGCVGAKLYYSDNRIQHAGVILGIGGVAGHSHKKYKRDHPGYFSRLQLTQNLSAVTAACLMIRRDVFDLVGGFDEDNLKIAFNDIDLCLKVREAGYRNIWTPHAELYHHESASRGYENTPEKQARFEKEVNYMKLKWGKVLSKDPYYNPNLTLEKENFSIKTN
jgi:glycosyltransferase involved in cell wall biosynthesis